MSSADMLAAHHAEADRLLAALAEPGAPQPGAAALGALRALRSGRHADRDGNAFGVNAGDEWAAYFRRRGADAVYSYLLTAMRAGLWPERYIADAGLGEPPSDAHSMLRALGYCGEPLGGAAAEWPHQIGAPRAPVREFAVEPFDERTGVRLWLVETDGGVYMPHAVRYNDALALELVRAGKTYLSRGLLRSHAPELADLELLD